MITPSLDASPMPIPDTRPSTRVYGRVDWLDANGNLLASWGVGAGLCSVGSGPNATLRIEDGGLAPVHFSLMFGKNYTLLKAIGPTQVGGRKVSEWLFDRRILIEAGAMSLAVYPPNAMPVAVVAGDRLSETTARLAAYRSNQQETFVRNMDSVDPSPKGSVRDTHVAAMMSEMQKNMDALSEAVRELSDGRELNAVQTPVLGADQIENLVAEHAKRCAVGVLESEQVTFTATIREEIAAQAFENRAAIERFERLLDERLAGLDERLLANDELAAQELGRLIERIDELQNEQDSIRSSLDAVSTLECDRVERNDFSNRAFELVAEEFGTEKIGTEENVAEENAVEENTAEENAVDAIGTDANGYEECGIEENGIEENGANEIGTKAEPRWDLPPIRYPEQQLESPSIDEVQMAASNAASLDGEAELKAERESEMLYSSDEQFDFSVDDEPISQRLARMLLESSSRQSSEQDPDPIPAVFTSNQDVRSEPNSSPPINRDAEANPLHIGDMDSAALYSSLPTENGNLDALVEVDANFLGDSWTLLEPTSRFANAEELTPDSSTPNSLPMEFDLEEQFDASRPTAAMVDDGNANADESIVVHPNASGDDEESIELYMQRLLQRVRTGSAVNTIEALIPSQPPSSSASGKLNKALSSESASAVVGASAIHSLSRLRPAAETLIKQAIRSVPEATADLAAFREIANSTARRAISRSDLRRKSSDLLFKLSVVMISLACALAILILNGLRLNAAMIGMIAAVIVGVLWGIDSVRQFQLVLQGQAALNRHDNAATEDESPQSN